MIQTKTIGDVEFSLDGKTLVKYRGNNDTYDIPTGIEKIASHSFEGTRVRKVGIPSTVTKISNFAFSNSSLEEIFIPKSVIRLGQSCFSQCFHLTKVDFEENSELESIGDNCFNSCAFRDIQIPDSVKVIGIYAFTGCRVKRITLPKNLIHLGAYAFCNCRALIELNIPEGISIIRESLCSGCRSLAYVSFPDNMVSIEKYAFSQCINLRGPLYFPMSLKEIGTGAFSHCTMLNDVNLPDNVFLGKNAFFRCTNLESVEFAEGVLLSPYSFKDCISLESISLPRSTKQIPKCCFANSGVTQVKYPEDAVVSGTAFVGSPIQRLGNQVECIFDELVA